MVEEIILERKEEIEIVAKIESKKIEKEEILHHLLQESQVQGVRILHQVKVQTVDNFVFIIVSKSTINIHNIS